MRTIQKEVYTFAELSGQAKERARDWYREGALDYDWWDSVYEDATKIAEIFGIDLKQKSVKLMSGATRYDPSIFFSGFCSQGDGACFEGRYTFAADAGKRIREYASIDKELHAIGDGLDAIQAANGNALYAQVKHRGHYSHEMCTDIDVDIEEGDGEEPRAMTEGADDTVKDLLRDFMRWIYRTLEKEHEYLTSDETVDDNITANEYEFDSQGRRAP